MKILVACEEPQAVTKELRQRSEQAESKIKNFSRRCSGNGGAVDEQLFFIKCST